jgi:diguanylate cyclase (GGDEF)-like protein
LDHANTLRERAGQPFGVLFMDLDNFKVINDTLGHPAGDELLVLVADRLCSCVGAADTVARLGGDEFAVLLEASVHDPAAIAAELRRVMEEPFSLSGQQVYCSLSIGLAAVGDDDLETAEYLRRADVAMYAAKAAGKNAVRVYVAELDHPATVGAARIAERGVVESGGRPAHIT